MATKKNTAAKNTTISEKVLKEILGAYAVEESRRPTEEAILELAAAAGKTREAVKQEYTRQYHSAGHSEEDDPWALDEAIMKDEEE
jgi:hypothetical protein